LISDLFKLVVLVHTFVLLVLVLSEFVLQLQLSYDVCVLPRHSCLIHCAIPTSVRLVRSGLGKFEGAVIKFFLL